MVKERTNNLPLVHHFLANSTPPPLSNTPPKSPRCDFFWVPPLLSNAVTRLSEPTRTDPSFSFSFSSPPPFFSTTSLYSRCKYVRILVIMRPFPARFSAPHTCGPSFVCLNDVNAPPISRMVRKCHLKSSAFFLGSSKNQTGRLIGGFFVNSFDCFFWVFVLCNFFLHCLSHF